MRLSSFAFPLLLCTQYATATLVQVDFTANLATISGNPFGLTSAADLNRTFSGAFRYDTGSVDTNASSSQGSYQQALASAGFSGTLAGISPVAFLGSLIPTITIDNTASGGGDAFRFVDGPNGSFPNRFLSVNGIANATAQLNFYIQSSFTSVISSDALPLVFNWGTSSISFPHTFSLADGSNGTLLFQLSSISSSNNSAPSVPEPGTVLLCALGVAGIAFARRR